MFILLLNQLWLFLVFFGILLLIQFPESAKHATTIIYTTYLIQLFILMCFMLCFAYKYTVIVYRKITYKIRNWGNTIKRKQRLHKYRKDFDRRAKELERKIPNSI